MLEYFQAALGQEWPSFLFFFAGTNSLMLNTLSYNVFIRFDKAEIRRLNAPYGRKQKKATGTFTRSFYCTKTLTTFIKTYQNVRKSSNLGYSMFLMQGENTPKNWLSLNLLECASFLKAL